jgi:hypothetical protein
MTAPSRRDITELELLALVEHDPSLAPERCAALLDDPTVARLTARLQADRESLSALPRTAPAPTGIVAAAIDRAEREALAALAAAEARPASASELRTSTFVDERPSVLARLAETRWPRRFAAAAAIAIAATGVYFIAAALIQWNASQLSHRSSGPVAVRPTPHVAPPTIEPAAPTPTEVAANPATDAPLATQVAIANGPIDAPTAAVIAPAGRVILIARAADPPKAVASMNLATLRAAGVTLWQPLSPGSPEFSAALAAAKASGFEPPTGTQPGVALLGLSGGAGSFDALLAALGGSTAFAGAQPPQWAAVDAATLLPTRARASVVSLQPGRVLWWEQGSTGWNRAVVVPVVVLP